MTVDSESFVEAFPFFAGRSQTHVAHAISTAQKMWDETACGALYDSIVEYQAAVLLMTSPKGGPTSKTKESNLRNEYQAVLDDLTMRVPARMAVAST